MRLCLEKGLVLGVMSEFMLENYKYISFDIAFFVYLTAYVIYCLVTRNTLMECIPFIKKLR